MSYTNPSNVLSDGAPAPLIFARSGQSAPNENCGRRRGHFWAKENLTGSGNNEPCP